MAFALVKGLVWAVTLPAFWAADEDYHFLYIESLTTQQQLPDRERPLYTPEYSAAVAATKHHEYGAGPRREFVGDPQQTVRDLANLPGDAREPTEFGRGVGVVHPPLYPVVGAIVNAAMGDASVLTRLTVLRFLSAIAGAIAVYFAWLLAAQVLVRFLHQFLAAVLVAVQPIFSYMSAAVNHDIVLVVAFGAALTMLLFMLRTAPRPTQGLWLGGSVAFALLIKASALVLLLPMALTYVAQACVHRPLWRQAARSAGLAVATMLVLAGGWYVYTKLAYGSFTGATTTVTSGAASGVPADERGIFSASLGELLRYVREWFAFTYRTYWWNFLWFEAAGPQSRWFYVPMAVGTAGIAGLARVVWMKRRLLLSANDPLLRQVVVMTVAGLVIMLPFLGVDVVRRTDGLGFFANSGRYLIPAFGCVASLFVIGVGGLVPRRLWTPALLLSTAAAVGFHLRVYDFHYVNRYFGHHDIGELLRRVSFDRPEFVTPTTVAIAVALAIGLFVAATVLALMGARREPHTRDPDLYARPTRRPSSPAHR